MIVHAIISLIIAGILCFYGSKEIRPPAPLLPLPSEEQVEWHEMEMNAFIHFTINTFTDLEWGMGNESPSLFNPSEADPEQWVKTIKKAGLKGVILTCKHHDGFCLWPSHFTEHSIKNSPYKNGQGNIVKELSDACKKHGLKFGVYLSPWDRNHSCYGKPEYITYYRNQLKELFTSYGPVFEMWFDGANGGTGYYGGSNETRRIDGRTYYDWPGTLDLIREFEPGIIFFSDAGPGVRWVGNEKGIAGETNWCTLNPDTLYAGKPGIEKLLNEGSENGTCWIPAETDVSIRPGWFWHEKENSRVKTPEELFRIYLTSVGRGSTLLLNIPPDRRGLIHEQDIQSLMGFRALINEAFNKNLAKDAKAEAGSYRGNSSIYSAGSMTDDDKNTFWCTDDGIRSEKVELSWKVKHLIKYVILQEYIRLGQRVKKFHVEAWENNGWTEIASGTTIGYKRILETKPINTSRIRICIDESKACPVISNCEIY